MQYNRKKTTYWQFNELATRWVSYAQEGELFAGYKNGNFEIVKAIGDDNLYTKYKTIPSNNEAIIEYYEEYIDDNNEQIKRESKEVF